jgi:hypothetical protein
MPEAPCTALWEPAEWQALYGAICLGLVLGVGHIDRQTQPHLSLAWVAGGLPGRRVFGNHWPELRHGRTEERHQQ